MSFYISITDPELRDEAHFHLYINRKLNEFCDLIRTKYPDKAENIFNSGAYSGLVDSIREFYKNSIDARAKYLCLDIPEPRALVQEIRQQLHKELQVDSDIVSSIFKRPVQLNSESEQELSNYYSKVSALLLPLNNLADDLADISDKGDNQKIKIEFALDDLKDIIEPLHGFLSLLTKQSYDLKEKFESLNDRLTTLNVDLTNALTSKDSLSSLPEYKHYLVEILRILNKQKGDVLKARKDITDLEGLDTLEQNSDNYVFIVVSDNGRGLPMDFNRGSYSTSRSQIGDSRKIDSIGFLGGKHRGLLQLSNALTRNSGKLYAFDGKILIRDEFKKKVEVLQGVSLILSSSLEECRHTVCEAQMLFEQVEQGGSLAPSPVQPKVKASCFMDSLNAKIAADKQIVRLAKSPESETLGRETPVTPVVTGSEHLRSFSLASLEARIAAQKQEVRLAKSRESETHGRETPVTPVVNLSITGSDDLRSFSPLLQQGKGRVDTSGSTSEAIVVGSLSSGIYTPIYDRVISFNSVPYNSRSKESIVRENGTLSPLPGQVNN